MLLPYALYLHRQSVGQAPAATGAVLGGNPVHRHQHETCNARVRILPAHTRVCILLSLNPKLRRTDGVCCVYVSSVCEVCLRVMCVCACVCGILPPALHTDLAVV